MAAIPERYFQEKTLGLLGASIYGAARAPREGFTASLRSACFHRCGHFVINLKLPKELEVSIITDRLSYIR
ncbi:hypothetical protein [Yersinia enterocolitica]|uniref:hypothetical protein n=1 Tax=Yersinia enterocolitica TaxID=630 RepID=UPI00067B2C30|nr:hypothetical protein [Yersinia enterocolitica]